MIRSTGPTDARSAGARTSPWTNSTPPARKRSTANSEPRRLRLSNATTDATERSRLSASAMFEPTNPAPPVTRIRSAIRSRTLRRLNLSASGGRERVRGGPDSGVRLGHRAARQHADQMRAIFGTGVNVAVHAGRRNAHALDRLGGETLLQRFLERLDAEHAAGAGAGDRDADVGAALGDKHADQGKARGRMLELFVGRLLGDRETDLDDDLALFQRGRIHAGEEIVGGDPPLVGDDGGP